jgi:AAA15 family ATPase/GTPase
VALAAEPIMQETKIKISNYRNISEHNPLEIELKEGILFILGINNVGKSNFLRFLQEMRQIFQAIHARLRLFLEKGQNRLEVNLSVNFDELVC